MFLGKREGNSISIRVSPYNVHQGEKEVMACMLCLKETNVGGS